MEPATVTAIANDVGTEVVFLRQLIAQAEPGDVAVAISTSGGSRNVIAALAEARKRRLLTVALLGYDGGEIRRQAPGRPLHRGRVGLHPADPGSPGVDLPHHAGEPARSSAMTHVELYGTSGCPYTRDMREWLELRGADFVEYDVEADRAARDAHARGGRRRSARCRCWWRTAPWCRSAGRDAAARWASSRG